MTAEHLPTLGELALEVRSKNAGPFWVTMEELPVPCWRMRAVLLEPDWLVSPQLPLPDWVTSDV